MSDRLSLGFQEEVIYRLRSLYNRAGYSQYKMSKFEEYDLYARNKDFLISDRVITFMDTNGRLMALKPDVTLSIVKNSRDGGRALQKLYYNENVYRVSPGAGCFREIMQVGLECLGSVDSYCLWEVLTLAAESLGTISRESVLDISHLGLLAKLLEDVGLPAGCREDALRFVAEKNTHGLAAMCRAFGIPEERIGILRQAVSCSGAPGEVLPKLRALLEQITDVRPLDGLMEITDALPEELRAMIRFDFSAVDDIRYYNGILFKGYVRGIPQRVLSGGQYDNLVHSMGKKSGAVGFAVYMDTLERLEEQREEYDADVLLLYDPDTTLEQLSARVRELKAEGKSVLVQSEIPEHIRVRRVLKLRAGEVPEK